MHEADPSRQIRQTEQELGWIQDHSDRACLEAREGEDFPEGHRFQWFGEVHAPTYEGGINNQRRDMILR